MVNTVSRQKDKKDFEEKKRRIEKRCVHNKSPVLTGTVLFLPAHETTIRHVNNVTRYQHFDCRTYWQIFHGNGYSSLEIESLLGTKR